MPIGKIFRKIKPKESEFRRIQPKNLDGAEEEEVEEEQEETEEEEEEEVEEEPTREYGPLPPKPKRIISPTRREEPREEIRPLTPTEVLDLIESNNIRNAELISVFRKALKI